MIDWLLGWAVLSIFTYLVLDKLFLLGYFDDMRYELCHRDVSVDVLIIFCSVISPLFWGACFVVYMLMLLKELYLWVIKKVL